VRCDRAILAIGQDGSAYKTVILGISGGGSKNGGRQVRCDFAILAMGQDGSAYKTVILGISAAPHNHAE